MMRFLIATAIVFAYFGAATKLAAASPEWHELRTDHFRLITSSPVDDAEAFALRVERFDAALRRLYNVADQPDLRSRPVTIYALEPDDFYQACDCGAILGYYSHPTKGPFIFVINSSKEKEKEQRVGTLNSQAVLLHEYSHHFMMTNFPAAYPYWYVEGFAEFNANVKFMPDGSVLLGYPANYRGEALLNGSALPFKKLVAPEVYGFADYPDQAYGRAWLLTHYLMLRPERNGQLTNYLEAINRGTPSLQAAQAAFGDFDKIDKELDIYMRGALAAPVRISPASKPPALAVRTLDPGEAASLLPWLKMTNGIPWGGGKIITNRFNGALQKYSADPVVLRRAAEAYFVVGKPARASELIDRALAAAPFDPASLVLKGQIVAATALEADKTSLSGWASGRSWYRKANRADPQWVEPFYRYFVSYTWAGQKPPQDAVAGLMRAAVLAPESTEISLALALQRLEEGDSQAARRLLVPLSSQPHRRLDENKSATVIALIDAGKLDEARSKLKELALPTPTKSQARSSRP